MKSLFNLSLDNTIELVRTGKMPLKNIDSLSRTARIYVLNGIMKYDFHIWKNNIMKSLAILELKKCHNYNIEWKKHYVDGTRDFREVLYIYHDGDEKFVYEEDEYLSEDEIDEDFVPEIKVKEINHEHDHFQSYMDALYIINGGNNIDTDELDYV